MKNSCENKFKAAYTQKKKFDGNRIERTKSRRTQWTKKKNEEKNTHNKQKKFVFKNSSL